jgi:hypothetical protein
LIVASIVMLGVHALHDLDHVRQGRSLEATVITLGVLAYAAGLAVLLMAWRRHPQTSHAAIAVGFATALGFVLVHVLPDWGPVADGYPGIDVDLLSWLIVVADIAGAAWLGWIGIDASMHRET